MTDCRTTRAHRTLLAMVTAFALFATACGGSAATTDESSAPPDATEASLVASTVAGGQIDFASFAGQDVVLWFWAPW